MMRACLCLLFGVVIVALFFAFAGSTDPSPKQSIPPWQRNWSQGTPGGSFLNYGIGCGSGPLTIVGNGSPDLGEEFGLKMINGRASSGGFIFLGAVQKSLGLTVAGMTGCTLYLDPIFSMEVAFDPEGVSTTSSFGVPDDPFFVGKTIFAQGANMDPDSNRLNLTASQGLTITFGK